MDTISHGEDFAVSLRLTQQFDPFLRVGYSEDRGAHDRFERDFHGVIVVTLQRQRVTGDYVVLDDEAN